MAALARALHCECRFARRARRDRVGACESESPNDSWLHHCEAGCYVISVTYYEVPIFDSTLVERAVFCTKR